MGGNVNLPPAPPKSSTPPASTPPSTPPASAPPSTPPPSTVSPWANPDSYSSVVPGMPGGPKPLWQQGYSSTGPSAPPSAPPAPAAPASTSGPLQPNDPNTAKFARSVADALGVKPEDVTSGKAATQSGPLTPEQTGKLTGAAKDYLLDTPIDKLSPGAGDAVRGELAKAGIKLEPGKSLKDIPGEVGAKIAENLAKDFGKSPGATVGLIAGGAAYVGGSVATGEKVTVKAGPVKVDGQVKLNEGGKDFVATAGASGTANLRNGTSISAGGSVTASSSGFEGANGSVRANGSIGNRPAYLGANGTVTRNPDGTYSGGGGVGGGFQPFKGGTINGQVGADSRTGFNAGANLTIILP